MVEYLPSVTLCNVQPTLDSFDGMKHDIAQNIMTTLQATARYALIPYLQEAATLALGILQIIDDVRTCQAGFTRLSRDSCELVYGIIKALPKDTGVSTALLDNLEALVRTLSSIYSYAKKETKRNLLIRIIKHKSDQGKIIEYREALRQSLDLFGLQSSVNIQGCMENILQQQNDILRQLPENNFCRRIYDTSYAYSTPVDESSFEKDFNILGITSEGYTDPGFVQETRNGPQPIRGTHGTDLVTNKSYQETNINSGNVTNTIITGSNNDWSVKMYCGHSS
ncbi:hypothetical protein BDZ94DRAFT_1312902 [Collybia nuda]|uniref:Uncharacterized protein n=1 Tax=Collybia nuda TaxID=64659 RepID=A0A9P5XY31_9AGAR|nr:hypothetical protein BDZ94DRAFT_1312902 [Collybia nuda]